MPIRIENAEARCCQHFKDCCQHDGIKRTSTNYENVTLSPIKVRPISQLGLSYAKVAEMIFRGLYYADFEIRKNPNDGAVEPVLTDIGSNVDFESFEASIPNFTNNLFDFLFCDDEASLPLIKL